MSLLIKSVWRGVLRAAPPLTQAALRTRSYAPSSVSDPRSTDAAMASIASAASPGAVLAAVQTHLPHLTHQHLLQALRSLFLLTKTSNAVETENLLKDPAFAVLCQNFKKQARALEIDEAIEATKFLVYLGVPLDSLISQTMLQLIRTQINNLNIRQIMFLDYLLTKFEGKNHLIDALTLALPLAFQIHLPIELDNRDLNLLKDMLFYATSHDLPDRYVNNVVTGLLLHEQAMDVQVAKSIVWSLCQVNCSERVFPTRVQLLRICYDILTQKIDHLSYDDVLKTVARIKGRILEKHQEYYHEQLMDAFANYVVKHDIEFEKGLLVARVLSRIAHTNLSLTDYLCQLVVSNPKSLSNARTNILFGFVNCLANNNYTPDHEKWETIRKQIASNPVLDCTNAALPWAKFCLELASLGHFEDKLLARVFSKQFLDEYLNREYNDLDYLQLFTLHEAVNTFYSQEYKLPPKLLEKAKQLYPTHAMTEQLEACLVRGLGSPDLCLRNVVLPNGFVADLLVAVKNGYPVELPIRSSSKKVQFEHLSLPPGSLAICLLNFNQGCFSLNSNRLRGTFRLVVDILEKQGYAAVPLNVSEWAAAPQHEKTPYLMREMGYKCGEIGMRLSVT